MLTLILMNTFIDIIEGIFLGVLVYSELLQLFKGPTK